MAKELRKGRSVTTGAGKAGKAVLFSDREARKEKLKSQLLKY